MKPIDLSELKTQKQSLFYHGYKKLVSWTIGLYQMSLVHNEDMVQRSPKTSYKFFDDPLSAFQIRKFETLSSAWPLSHSILPGSLLTLLFYLHLELTIF